MKLAYVTFSFSDKAGEIIVRFADDSVMVVRGTDGMVFSNKPGKWGGRPYKPCVSNCKQLIAHAFKQKPPTEQARRKKVTTKPKLQLVSE